MNIETIKTIILTILVAISLILTFGLWNYQPNLDYLSNTRSEYVNEVDLGGTEETKNTIIEPTAIIFHKENHYFGFTDPRQRQSLFRNIQEWPLDDYTLSNVQGRPTNPYQVEVIFPTSLSMGLIENLFTLINEDELPSWSFKRMFITFNQTHSTLQISFLSTDGQQQVNYTVKDSSIYNYLWSSIHNESDLHEFIIFNQGREPIYLPAESLEINSRSFTVRDIEPYLLVNALFNNPSNVSPNMNEAYFTDGQRGMRLLNDNRRMEFINPIHASDERMDPLVLLDRSLSSINEHKGWTNKFILVDMNTLNNQVRYRMFYNGYPIFSRVANGELSIIEQQWLNQDLHLYRRPLFSLDNLLGGDTVTLPSGRKVIEYLEESEYYDPARVNNIQVGYRLTYLESSSYSISLDPTWFMNYSGEWMEIVIENHEPSGTFKGVN